MLSSSPSIPNPTNLDHLIRQFQQDGPDSLFLVSDFDRTLTKARANGTRTSSIISRLRDGDYLTADYSRKAKQLFAKYHPIELDPYLSFEEKSKKMEEWWRVHNELLIESGLSLQDLQKVADNGEIVFRRGATELFDLLHAHNIPLIVISASGCGEIIEQLFARIGKNYPNFHYIINRFNWDEQGRAISTKGRVIHGFAKSEDLIKEEPEIYSKIQERNNCMLLGDSLGDLKMMGDGLEKNLLKIGFFNLGGEDLRQKFDELFDVVIEDDGELSYVNELLLRLVK